MLPATQDAAAVAGAPWRMRNVRVCQCVCVSVCVCVCVECVCAFVYS